uniref:Conserved hypothetical BEN domain protein n=1 Tax=Cotesia sesamiae Kitale bracovirus TaxID=452648 RepID=S0DHB8_9VIRU|nr:conserved hypothetical BEN domain protein [Cotesia sesamiae Kitale bracovirus]
MMRRSNDNRRAFYVVQFIELPFEGIDNYVCVPCTWMIVRKATEHNSVVAYPIREDPSVTRDRVKSKERCNDEMRFYVAIVKYETDSYRDAEYWIKTRNDYGSLVEEELKTIDTEPKFPLNKKLRIANRSHSTKLNDNSRKRMKQDDAAQSSSTVVTVANAEPGSSKQEQSMIAQDNQLIESAQIETTASDSNGTASSSILQQSLQIQEQQESSIPFVDVDTPILVINDNEEAQPTSIEEQQVPSNQAVSQFRKQPEPNQVPQIVTAPSIEMTQKLVEKRGRLRKIKRNLDIATQNPSNLIDEQDLLRKSAESKNYKQRQSQPSQQDSQRQSRKPKIRIGISLKPKNNRPTPTHQVTKETLSPILTKVLNSLRQTLSITHSQYLLNDEQFQENHSKRALVNENHLNEIDNTIRTNEWVKETTPSAHHGENSNYDTVSDHEEILDHEMSADEAPIERTNNFYGTGITSESSYADRPIDAQNSTNHQTHSKVVLEQQMLDNFSELSTQMGSTLRYTCDMYNTLRSSILDSATAYKKLLGAVEQFNSTQNSAGSGSFSINLKPGVRQSPEERQTEVTASTSSGTQNQQSNDDANKPPKKKHNSWRFVLPPEYDPHDTRWTLKYRTNLPGLVELMPQSGVYVSYGDLIYCQQVSKDCQSLARRLLLAVFNRKALSVCSTITEKAQASDDVRSNIRPELDDNACSALLSFVTDFGLQRGWNTDLQPILSTLHSKIQAIRLKYGVVVQC